MFLEKEDKENVEIENEIYNENDLMETDEMHQETAKDVANNPLEMLKYSHLKILRSDRTLSLGKRKIKGITTKLKNVVSMALSEPQLAQNGG